MIFTVDNVCHPANVCSWLSTFLIERNAGFPVKVQENKAILLPCSSTGSLELRVCGLFGTLAPTTWYLWSQPGEDVVGHFLVRCEQTPVSPG